MKSNKNLPRLKNNLFSCVFGLDLGSCYVPSAHQEADVDNLPFLNVYMTLIDNLRILKTNFLNFQSKSRKYFFENCQKKGEPGHIKYLVALSCISYLSSKPLNELFICLHFTIEI